MEASALRLLCLSAARQDKFIYMDYNDVWRNVRPLALKKEGENDYLYAWCELHPGNPVERFRVDQIVSARVSVDDDYLTNASLSVNKFEGAEDE